jgi:hypothetical protein
MVLRGRQNRFVADCHIRASSMRYMLRASMREAEYEMSLLHNARSLPMSC